MLLWGYIHTGQAEKLAWPRWESNLRPLEAICGISELRDHSLFMTTQSPTCLA
jgi:hypothetical protein